MNHADPKFIKLIDIIQATPMARINREDARHIAERLVEAGVIREEVLDPSADEIAKQIRVFANQDNLFMRTVEARAKEYIKPVLMDEQPLDMQPVRPYSKADREASWARFRQAFSPGLQQAILNEGPTHPNHPDRTGRNIPWDIDNDRPYEEWEVMLIDGRGPDWDVFRNSYPTSLQKAILAQGKGHPNHPEHDHTDCCK